MKYKADQILTYIPKNQRVTVVHVTPYHEDGDPDAFVTVQLADGDLRSIPVALQDRFLTVAPPKKTGPGLKFPEKFKSRPAEQSPERPADDEK